MKETAAEKAERRSWLTWRKWGVVGTKARAAKEFQKMIRYEAADQNGMVTCITCGFSNHWKNTDNLMDCGHFVGGRSNSVAFLEDNAHPQCVRCNQFGSGRLDEYERWMIAAYGSERVKEIRRLRNETVKLTAKELDDMRLSYKERIKAQLKRLN